SPECSQTVVPLPLPSSPRGRGEGAGKGFPRCPMISSWQHLVKRWFAAQLRQRRPGSRVRPQVVQLEARTLLEARALPTFLLPRHVDVGNNPNAVAAVDVNGDGQLDLLTANMGASDNPGSTVSVLLGNGDGTFGEQRPFTVGSSPIAVRAADVNGDGRPDLIIANSADNTVSVLLGNGDGTFQDQRTFAVGSDPVSVAVADVNG